MNYFNKSKPKNNWHIIMSTFSVIMIIAAAISLFPAKKIFLIVLGVSALTIVLLRPFYGLCFLAFSIPYAGILQIAPKLTGNKIFAVWVLVAYIAGKLIKREKLSVLIPDGLFIYSILFFWTLTTLPFTFITDDSLTAIFSKGFLLGLVILVTAMIQDFKDFKLICLMTSVGASLLGIYISVFGMGELVGEYGTRLAAGTNENVLAHALGVGLLLSFFSLKDLSKKARYIIISLDIFIIYAILLTGSRGTWIALVISVLLIPLLAGQITLKKRLNIFIGGSLALLALFWGLSNNLFGQWGQLVTGRLSEHETIIQASGGRIHYIWPFFLKKAMEKPLTGWGAGYSQYLDRSAHNDFLYILVELGSIGLLIFFAFLIFTLKDIYSFRDKTQRLISMMLFSFLLVSGMTHNTVSLKSYALALGVLFFLSKMHHKERDGFSETGI